jgi:hypothetical protein
MISESEIIELAESHWIFRNSRLLTNQDVLAFATEIRNRTLESASAVCGDIGNLESVGVSKEIATVIRNACYMKSQSILALKGDEK